LGAPAAGALSFFERRHEDFARLYREADATVALAQLVRDEAAHLESARPEQLDEPRGNGRLADTRAPRELASAHRLDGRSPPKRGRS
jgi:hypothetical protein